MMTLFRSSSRRRIVFSYMVGSGLLLLVFYLALSALHTYRVDNHDLVRRYEFARALTDIDRMQKDAEISQLGFLLTNKRRYLEPYTEADTLIWNGMQELRKSTAGKNRPEMAGYEEALRRKFDYLKDSVARRDEGLVEPLQIVFAGAGREASADLESSYRGLLTRIRDELDRTQSTADRAARSAEKLLYQVGALALAIFSLAMWGILRDVRRREAHEAELLHARAAALRVSDFKTQFLSIMSHEVRTPLNSIMGVSELLEETPLDDQQKKYVQTFKRSGDMLLRIVNDILDLSKIEAGQMELESSPVTVKTWLAEIEQIMQARAEQKKLALLFENQLPENTVLMLDGNRIRQVLLNLLGNSIKFTEQGRVTLAVRRVSGVCPPPAGGAPSPPSRDRVEFTVQDTGPGMSGEQVSRLFRPFQQAEISTARKYGGTGLGLFISKKILSLAGGEIMVKSEPGRGTRFIVTIPAVFAEEAAETPPPGPSAPAHSPAHAPDHAAAVASSPLVAADRFRGKKILIVDDVPDNCDLLQHFLVPLGFNITVGSDGRQAVDLFESGTYDLILMDMQMPVMNGLEAARRIREIEKEKNLTSTAIVALTAQAYQEELDRCLQAGCNLYLSKPFKKNQLFSVIDRVLN